MVSFASTPIKKKPGSRSGSPYRKAANDEKKPFWYAQGPFIVNMNGKHRYRASAILEMHQAYDHCDEEGEMFTIVTANNKTNHWGEGGYEDFYVAFLEALHFELRMQAQAKCPTCHGEKA